MSTPEIMMISLMHIYIFFEGNNHPCATLEMNAVAIYICVCVCIQCVVGQHMQCHVCSGPAHV